MLLSYLRTLEQDAYTLAIQFAFYGIFRVGEIKGLTWGYEERKYYHNQAAIGRRTYVTRGYDFQPSSPCLKGSKGQSFLQHTHRRTSRSRNCYSEKNERT